ncbi:MAG TPA: hypothetical protein VGB71_19370, partial [Flavisolibacter sp.]
SKMNAGEFAPDQYVKLSSIDQAFAEQKVESVCVEKVMSNELLLHLVADNDNGSSNLFKLRIKL